MLWSRWVEGAVEADTFVRNVKVMWQLRVWTLCQQLHVVI